MPREILPSLLFKQPTVTLTTLNGKVATVDGTAEPGYTIKLYANNVFVGTAITNPDGTFSVSSSNLAPGLYDLYIIASPPTGTESDQVPADPVEVLADATTVPVKMTTKAAVPKTTAKGVVPTTAKGVVQTTAKVVPTTAKAAASTTKDSPGSTTMEASTTQQASTTQETTTVPITTTSTAWAPCQTIGAGGIATMSSAPNQNVGPPPPGAAFNTSTKADGWDLAFHPDGLRVFNIPHYNTRGVVNCMVSCEAAAEN